ncbi:polysaccharide deacetylase [Breoghania corrubedonensis]|uniref:Chitooligosaccharide deacetylase n=1 Tax=Breoghania corrubedonensis TaxID=665038 RepID=A0A2T5VG49_9HYPH|nr:polysaccharide deacetylase family protein [Breoghania corrubedonensis]PTW62731.1 polysaccharide deacetylase [Breoghania corrubedonensis]
MLARTLVLTFHGLGEPIVPPSPGEGRYFVACDTYRRTIHALCELEDKNGIRARVTFDDGNLSDYTQGMPALIEAKRSATFFVLAGRIDQTGYLSGAQLREMVAAGMTIGTHGWDHVDWCGLDAAGRTREMVDARRKIEDAAECAVNEAAIPFGRFDKAVLAQLKRLDYARIYTSTGGLSRDTAWFCPRWSATDTFDPQRDLPARVGPGQVLRGTLYAPLRRLRYRI